MFNIKSFVKKPGLTISSLEDLNKNPDKYLIDIEEKDELIKHVNKLNFDYLDGAILIKYIDDTIIGYKEWDLVDQLWSYLVNITSDYLINGNSAVHFPDQPIKLEFFRRSNDVLQLNIEKGETQKSWVLQEKQFLIAILDSAKVFFNCLASLGSTNSTFYNDEVKRIESIINNNKNR